jgi:hypothetical protein
MNPCTEKAPDLIEQVMAFVREYRVAGGDPCATQRAVQERFPDCTGGTYAIALGRLNRERANG